VTGLEIRDAAGADSAQIARLVTELGYPTSAAQMQRRLQAILQDRDYDTLVACDGNQVVGFIGTRLGSLYEDDERCGQIMALAVTAGHRRRGVGRALVAAAEARLLGRGIRLVVVTSGNHRADAHAFYESGGYTFTGRRYKKAISSQS
jgi:predicted N-acetyltransferase YhbS